jgi:hypothetical protein
MTLGPFHILKYEVTSAQSFVELWSRQYRYDQEPLYIDNIGKPITPHSLSTLYEWKNGRTLSGKKRKSIERYDLPAERIDADADMKSLREFLCKPGGAIWRIFWLHIQYHERFPIYDQHVHRAMAYLKGWPDLEIESRDPRKVDAYLGHYLPFVASWGYHPMRELDRAYGLSAASSH